jgi:hypothetical protein
VTRDGAYIGGLPELLAVAASDFNFTEAVLPESYKVSKPGYTRYRLQTQKSRQAPFQRLMNRRDCAQVAAVEALRQRLVDNKNVLVFMDIKVSIYAPAF